MKTQQTNSTIVLGKRSMWPLLPLSYMGLTLSLIGEGAQAHKTVQLLANLSIPPPRLRSQELSLTALCIQTRIHLPAQLSSTFSKKALVGTEHS